MKEACIPVLPFLAHPGCSWRVSAARPPVTDRPVVYSRQLPPTCLCSQGQGQAYCRARNTAGPGCTTAGPRLALCREYRGPGPGWGPSMGALCSACYARRSPLCKERSLPGREGEVFGLLPGREAEGGPGREGVVVTQQVRPSAVPAPAVLPLLLPFLLLLLLLL